MHPHYVLLAVVPDTTLGSAARIGDLDPARARIVPGSHVRDDGSLGPVVAERVEAEAELYQLRCFGKVLVSGRRSTSPAPDSAWGDWQALNGAVEMRDC